MEKSTILKSWEPKWKRKENGEDRDKVYYETLSDASRSTLGSPTASPALAQARPSVTRFLESASALPSSLELRWDSTYSLLICKKCYKLIPRTPLARRVRRTPMATMQSRVVKSAAVAPRGQMGTWPAGTYIWDVQKPTRIDIFFVQFGLWPVQLRREGWGSSVRPLCVGSLELPNLWGVCLWHQGHNWENLRSGESAPESVLFQL